jgi:hypothetical protein
VFGRNYAYAQILPGVAAAATAFQACEAGFRGLECDMPAASSS